MSVIRRWSSDPRVLVDVAVAVVVAVLSVVDVASANDVGMRGQRSADALAYALVIAGSLSLFWRRRAPLAVLAIVIAVLIIVYLREYGALLSVLGLPALYAVAAHEEHRRRAWWAMVVACVAVMLAACVSVLDAEEGFAYLTALSMVAFLAAAMTAGVLIRNRERIFVDTERRAAAAEADRLAEAERAVASERSRIAREMHDVVAHSMSVVAVQAAAGRAIVHANPDKAADVFARIESVGRESLAELRRMLGVLRDTGAGDASLSPQPGIADIAGAVAQSSASGVATELVVDGRQRDIAPGIELAAYRIVQEALTNVRKHARSSRAHVTLERSGETVRLLVRDEGRGFRPGDTLNQGGPGERVGVPGMRERISLLGGRFEIHSEPGSGTSVVAEVGLSDMEEGTNHAI